MIKNDTLKVGNIKLSQSQTSYESQAPLIKNLEAMASSLTVLTKQKDAYASVYATTSRTLSNIKSQSLLPEIQNVEFNPTSPCSWAQFGGQNAIYETSELDDFYAQWNVAKNNYLQVLKELMKKQSEMILFADANPTLNLSMSKLSITVEKIVKLAQEQPADVDIQLKSNPDSNQETSSKSIMLKDSNTYQGILSQFENTKAEYNAALQEVTSTERQLDRYFTVVPYQIEFSNYMQQLCVVYNEYIFAKDTIRFGFKDLATQLRDGFLYGSQMLFKMGNLVQSNFPGENSKHWAQQFFIGAQAMEKRAEQFIYEAVERIRGK